MPLRRCSRTLFIDKFSSVTCNARAELTLANHKKPDLNITRKINHRFRNGNDWGFHSFIKRQDLLDPKQGFTNEIDEVTFAATINADVPSVIVYKEGWFRRWHI